MRVGGNKIRIHRLIHTIFPSLLKVGQEWQGNYIISKDSCERDLVLVNSTYHSTVPCR